MAAQNRINNTYRLRRNPVDKDKRHHRQHSRNRGCTTREMGSKITCRTVILLGAQVMMMLSQRDKLQAE